MKKIYLSPPHMGPYERELLLDAFDSNWIAPLGPHVDAFENEIASRLGEGMHAVALSSGTAALHLALRMLGVGNGDEVLVSSFTFSATVNAIIYQNAIPVFIDSDCSTWNMNPDLLEDELASCSKRGLMPKAVIVVDLYGQCADYDRINTICAKYNVPVIEDAAEALGASYKGRAAGSFGALGTFSFNGNKIITTSGGGMLVSKNKSWIDKARYWATQARDPAPHYQHSEIGFNYRLSNLLAAVGRGQLKVLDERIRLKRAVRDSYHRKLMEMPGIGFMPEASCGKWNGWLTCITIDPKLFGRACEDIRIALEKAQIEARPLWKPMHMQPVFREYRVRGGRVSKGLFECGLCLPSGGALSEEDVVRIVSVIQSVRKSVN